METIQYNAALARKTIPRIRFGDSNKLCCFYKILKSQSPKYLYSIILTPNMSCRTRQCNKIPVTNVKHDFFKNTFFSSIIIEWNKLDLKIKNSESIETFKKTILPFIRSSPSSTFN